MMTPFDRGLIRYQLDQRRTEPCRRSCGLVVGVLVAWSGLVTAQDVVPRLTLEPAEHGETRMADRGVYGLAFSPDGMTLAVVGGEQVGHLLDTPTLKERVVLNGHRGIVFRVAYLPDGKRLATAGSDGTVRIFDSADGRESKMFSGRQGQVRGLSVSPDGRRIYSGDTDAMRMGQVLVWDVETGESRQAIPSYHAGIDGLALSRDGKLIATASKDGTARVWRAEGGENVVTIKSHKGYVGRVAFSATGNTLISSANDKTVRLTDSTSGRELREIPRKGFVIPDVAVSSDGTILASNDDGTLLLWDISKIELLARHEESKGLVTAIAFSPDDKMLAVGYHNGLLRMFRIKRTPPPAGTDSASKSSKK